MKKISLCLVAQSPLAITAGATTGVNHETLHYIPGTMLLGAIAKVYKNEHNLQGLADEDPTFKDLFLSGKVQWGYALPSTKDGKTSIPQPLCFQKLKGHGGLAKENCEDEAFVYNTLFIKDFSELEKLYQTEFKDEYLQGGESLPKPKKMGEGFITNTKEPHKIDVNESYTMHVALDQTRKAVDAQLYGYSSINEGTKFVSEIYVDDSLEATLVQLLSKLKERLLYVGTSKSAGYGCIRVESVSKAETVKTQVCGYHKQNHRFTALLTSDYVPKRAWESVQESLEREMSEALDGKVELDLEKTFGLDSINTGFYGVWKLPRTAIQSLKLGSVLSFKVNFDYDENKLPVSIGAYKQEGLGRLLYDPIALVNTEGDGQPSMFVYVQNHEKAIAKSATLKKVDACKQNVFLNINTPAIKAIRKRSLIRQAKDHSLLLVSKAFTDFLNDVKDLKEPTANQRGNLRALFMTKPNSEYLKFFEDKLEKTPGQQWKTNCAKSPITSRDGCVKAGRKEYLADIFKCLLNQQNFEQFVKDNSFDINKLTLIGEQSSPLSSDEQKLYLNELQRATLLELLSIWDKSSRV